MSVTYSPITQMSRINEAGISVCLAGKCMDCKKPLTEPNSGYHVLIDGSDIGCLCNGCFWVRKYEQDRRDDLKGDQDG